MQWIHFYKKSFCLLILFFFFNCAILFPDKKKDNSLQFLTGLGIIQTIPDVYAKLVFMNPLFLYDTLNTSLITDYTISNTSSSNKKLVLIHGWNTLDPALPVYPTENDLKNRIISQWEHILKADQDFLKTVITKGYDVYFFTYLTSSSIESNGVRFRYLLNNAFSSQNSNVYIFAHSMGGLVSRIALYQNNNPTYLNKIISSGTPYHGSPWASSSYQKDKSVIGDIAGFLTNTEGGQNLAWDNFDSSITNASNSVLSRYNSNTSRDSLIKAYYGSINSDGSNYSGTDLTLTVGCATLGSVYSPSDCVVPESSGKLSGGGITQSVNIGGYNHVDLNLRVNAVKTQTLSDLP
ncbi:MAG: hypothetical protein EBS19_10675 [Spirochaetia bacterium]|nr:hypothetical protein [Spirochaetia bacterium]